jgi:hypothetical protein
VTGFDQLAADFAKAAFGVQSAMRDVFHDTADETKKGWQDNIRAVAPKHLPHAPKSITTETRLTGTSVRAEVGPEAGREQANLVLGDELGSRNQAPHLSGQRAAEPAGKNLERRADSVIAHLLP